MILVDSNVLIDVLTPDQEWRNWSYGRITSLTDAGEELVVNLIVVAELASNFPDMAAMYVEFEKLDIEVLPLTDTAAFQAGRAYRAYRRAHRERNAILADFLIAGHALDLGASLLTRDRRIATYFPDLTLITPETTHG